LERRRREKILEIGARKRQQRRRNEIFGRIRRRTKFLPGRKKRKKLEIFTVKREPFSCHFLPYFLHGFSTDFVPLKEGNRSLKPAAIPGQIRPNPKPKRKATEVSANSSFSADF